MKKSVPRLILYVLLLIKAFSVVIPDYENIPLLISVAVTMIVLAIAVFIDTTESMARHMLWYAAAAILLFAAFPEGVPDLSDLGDVLSVLWDAAVDSIQNPVFMIAGIAFVVLQLLFRRSDNRVLMVLRYVGLYFVLTCFTQELVGGSWLFEDLILVVTILCLVYELNGTIDGDFRPRILGCSLFTLFAVVIHELYGYRVINTVVAFISFGDDNWIASTVAVLVIGLLLVLENWNNTQILNEDTPSDNEMGEAMLCWCLVAVVMQMWDDVMHKAVLYILFPFVFHFYCVFLKAHRINHKDAQKGIFIKSWALILLGMVVFAKCLNFNHFIAGTIAVLLVCGYLCWSVSGRVNRQPQIMNAFLGIAAAVLMSSMSFRSLDQLQDNVGVVIVTLIGCLAWCFVCAESEKLTANASEAYPAEYNRIMGAQRIGCIVMLLIASVRVLTL